APALLGLILGGQALAAESAPFAIVETGAAYWRLDDAVNAVGDRDATIRIAPGVYRDCAVQERGRIAFVAAEPGKVVFDGGTCEDKAALVLRGRGASVDGIIFRNMRVPDANGAGIRLEQGPLTVTNATFRDSEQGILSADDPSATIRIDRSTFSGLGRCDRGLSCAHSIYIGHYGALVVTRSRFERGNGGHYVKSRAARAEISDSSFDDTQGKATNYMIDLPAGSVGTITRNMFVQGPNKENHSAMITVAAEARENSSRGLSIAGNTASLAPGVS
ncbi:MAG: right-handed parallel beta-helix repeat-containing protein, partial [Sphingomonadaceae bacterium]